jgi:hypothetical protein
LEGSEIDFDKKLGQIHAIMIPKQFLRHIHRTTCYSGGRALMSFLTIFSVLGAVAGSLLAPLGIVGYWLGVLIMVAIQSVASAVFDMADAALLRMSLESTKEE